MTTKKKLQLVAPLPAAKTSLADVFGVLQRYADDRRNARAGRPATASDVEALRDLVLTITSALDTGSWESLRRASTAARSSSRDERRAAVVETVAYAMRCWRIVTPSVRRLRDETRAQWEERCARGRRDEATLAKSIVVWLAADEPAFGKLAPADVADLFRSRGARREIGIAAVLSVRCSAFGDRDLLAARGSYRGALGRQRRPR